MSLGQAGHRRSANGIGRLHMSESRAGGALFSPRVRPARRRADPVAWRAPARPRRGRRSSRARAGPGHRLAGRVRLDLQIGSRRSIYIAREASMEESGLQVGRKTVLVVLIVSIGLGVSAGEWGARPI